MNTFKRTDSAEAWPVYFPPTTAEGLPPAKCLWGDYARILRNGGVRRGVTLPELELRRRRPPLWMEELGVAVDEPVPEVSNRNTTFDLILKMRDRGWHPEQIEQALSDRANVGGAWFRWSPNPAELDRCVHLADEVIAERKQVGEKWPKPKSQRKNAKKKTAFHLNERLVQRYVQFVSNHPGCTVSEMLWTGLGEPPIARRDGVVRAARQEALDRHLIYVVPGKQNRKHHYRTDDDRDGAEHTPSWDEMTLSEQDAVLREVGAGLDLGSPVVDPAALAAAEEESEMRFMRLRIAVQRRRRAHRGSELLPPGPW